MVKTRVLGTGLSGLVGTYLVQTLSDEFEFVNLDLTNGVDILKPESIEKVIQENPAAKLIHLAAFTDANEAQKQNGDMTGAVYQVNVEGTRNIAQACQEHGIYLIHLSTGYVFDGQKSEPYLETDKPNPTDWYSETKLLAEKVVQEITPNASIMRIDFPYRPDEFPKLDIWHKMAQNLQAGKTGPFFSDHYFNLTPLVWFAEVIRWALRHEPAGIFHAVTEKVYTDLTLAQEIARSLNIDDSTLTGSSVHEYNQTANRPYQPSLVLANQKLLSAMENTQL